MVIYTFNEPRFHKEIKHVGGKNKLPNTQVEIYGKYVSNCSDMNSNRRVQNDIIRGLLKCKLKQTKKIENNYTYILYVTTLDIIIICY
jgi:hypothetical protein